VDSPEAEYELPEVSRDKALPSAARGLLGIT
jgi:hypothetical protein